MASTASSIINLTKTIIGAGLLAIPYSFKANGIVPGLALVVLAGVASWYGLFIVAKVSRKIKGESSFFTLCSITYPKLSLLFDFSIAIQCFGVALSYLVLFGDLVPSLIGYVLSRNQVILLSLLITVPLISFRKLDSLKIGSLIALVAVAYMSALVVGHACLDDDLSKTRGEVRIWSPHSISESLSTFSIIIFAFTAAQNICSIVNEIQDKSQLNLVIIAACVIAGTLFSVVGLSGYLQFGSNVSGNVIMDYNPDLLSSKIGKCALTLMVALSYPLMFHPCRISINNMAYWIETHLFLHRSTSETQPLLSTEEEEESHHVEVPFSDHRFLVISILLTLATYTLALTVSSFELVLSLVGATGSTMICFILPGLFGYKLFDTQRHQVLSLLLSVWGVVVMIASVFATLYYR